MASERGKTESPESTGPIAIDSDEREGNDIAALVGSGAPMVTIRANAGCLGLASGETTTLVQSEEVRLLAQGGLLSILDESATNA